MIKLTALLLPLTFLTAPRLSGAQFSAVVVDVYDGDTLTVRDQERTVNIRLSGIDSPETNQPFGAHARSFTADLAIGRIVTIIEDKTDRYGRLTAWVILPDGRNLNEEIVAAGWAWWYRQYSPGSRVLAALESEACNRHRGLWAAGDPTAPWEWRKHPLRSKRSDRRDTGRARR